MKIPTTPEMSRFNDAVFAADLLTEMIYDSVSSEKLAAILAAKGRPLIATELLIASHNLRTKRTNSHEP